jgi:hypothetical protein
MTFKPPDRHDAPLVPLEPQIRVPVDLVRLRWQDFGGIPHEASELQGCNGITGTQPC